jgi:hypothetical protein
MTNVIGRLAFPGRLRPTFCAWIFCGTAVALEDSERSSQKMAQEWWSRHRRDTVWGKRGARLNAGYSVGRHTGFEPSRARTG